MHSFSLLFTASTRFADLCRFDGVTALAACFPHAAWLVGRPTLLPAQKAVSGDGNKFGEKWMANRRERSRRRRRRTFADSTRHSTFIHRFHFVFASSHLPPRSTTSGKAHNKKATQILLFRSIQYNQKCPFCAVTKIEWIMLMSG